MKNVSDLSGVMQVSEPCFLADVVYTMLYVAPRGDDPTAKPMLNPGKPINR